MFCEALTQHVLPCISKHKQLQKIHFFVKPKDFFIRFAMKREAEGILQNADGSKKLRTEGCIFGGGPFRKFHSIKNVYKLTPEISFMNSESSGKKSSAKRLCISQCVSSWSTWCHGLGFAGVGNSKCRHCDEQSKWQNHPHPRPGAFNKSEAKYSLSERASHWFPTHSIADSIFTVTSTRYLERYAQWPTLASSRVQFQKSGRQNLLLVRSRVGTNLFQHAVASGTQREKIRRSSHE